MKDTTITKANAESDNEDDRASIPDQDRVNHDKAEYFQSGNNQVDQDAALDDIFQK